MEKVNFRCLAITLNFLSNNVEMSLLQIKNYFVETEVAKIAFKMNLSSNNSKTWK